MKKIMLLVLMLVSVNGYSKESYEWVKSVVGEHQMDGDAGCEDVNVSLEIDQYNHNGVADDAIAMLRIGNETFKIGKDAHATKSELTFNRSYFGTDNYQFLDRIEIRMVKTPNKLISLQVKEFKHKTLSFISKKPVGEVKTIECAQGLD